MEMPFLGQIRKACKIGALALTFGALPVLSQTYTVDGSTNLTTIATQVQGKSSGVIRVQFKTYQNVGQFSISSLSADSLIFERAEESAEAVEFSGKLFHFENVTSHVIFRNIAFKAKNGSAIFLDAALSSSPNQNVLIDSCQIFGDTLNTTFLSWLGGPNSRANIQRTIISANHGTNPKIEITSDSMKVANSYLNYGGVFSATLVKRLDINNISSNRVQFKLTGDGTTVSSFKNNLFGHPPIVNRLPGNANKCVMYFLGFISQTAYGDYRFSTWYNFEYPANDGHADPSNTSIAPFGDTSAIWEFKKAGDSSNGYQNPIQAKFPAYNVFPGDTILSLRLTSKDSVPISFTSSIIPRVIVGSYGTASYPSSTDSTRTLWLKDTTLQVTGPVSIKSIAFPKTQSQGIPLLFYQSGSNFLPGPAGQEGSLTYSNPLTSARIFIPAFSGQNTAKGNSISVKGFSADTALIFSTITRAGRTSFQTPTLVSVNKRWRVIQKSGKSLSFKDSTNAEGTGDLVFGFGKAGTDAPFLADSLTWWLGGSSFIPKTDSAGKYWGKSSFASINQALLIERLAVGQGRDTMTIPQGRIITSSVVGHQLKVDSSFQPDQSLFPDMGSFSKGLSFGWAGRVAGDSLFLVFNKSNPLQKAFWRTGSKPTVLVPFKEDSASLTIAMGIGDSGNIVFIARKYIVPAGIKTDLQFGLADSIIGLLSSKPGNIFIDTSITPSNGLDLTTTRLLGNRTISLDSLEIQGNYFLSFPAKVPIRKDSVRVVVFDGKVWKPIAKLELLNRYSVFIDKSITAVAILEGLPNQDLVPKQPAIPATKSVVGNTLNILPNLTTDEKANIKSFNIDLFSIDLTGKAIRESSGFIAIDSAASLALKDNKIYAYRVIYKSLADRQSLDTLWIPLGERQFDVNSVQELAPTEKAKFWHLIGFPFKGTYKSNIEVGLTSKTSKDQVELDILANNQWSAVSTTTNLNFERGAAFLFGGTLPFQIKVGASALPSLSPDTIKFQETGWHLVSNPFPFPIPDTKIKLDPSKISFFQSLRRLDTASESKGTYAWDVADTLFPFQGYLVYTFGKSEIVFDPFFQALTPASKTAGAQLGPQAIKLILSNGKENSSMTFFTGEHFRETPYFQPLNAGLEMKVGANGGFLYKPEVRLDSIESELVIHSKNSGFVSLSAIAMDEGRSQLPKNLLPDIRLIDIQSGQVYGGEGLHAIQVNEGNNSFKILAGTSSSLDQRVNSTLAGMPTTFTMGQNFPNPFFSETQIRYQIPLNIGKILEVRIDVFDLGGKIIQTLKLETATIGYHAVRIGGKNWTPGIYISQLTVKTNQKVLSLERKMIHGASGI